MNLFAYAFGNPTRFTDSSGTQPENPQVDADGIYWLPEQFIEVSGTAPRDNYGRQVAAELSRPLQTRAAFGADLAAQINAANGPGSPMAIRQEVEWALFPEDAQAAWDSRVEGAFTKYNDRADVALDKQQSRMKTAYVVGAGLGVGIPAAAGLMAGGIVAAPEIIAAAGHTAAVGRSVVGVANTFAASVLGSGPKLLAAGVGYGILAPVGAPDLPTPVDDSAGGYGCSSRLPPALPAGVAGRCTSRML